MHNEEVQNSLVRLIPLVGKAFAEVFVNEYGYLYDFVDGDYVDWSVRPNMIFAVALDHSPLDSKQKKKVLADYSAKSAAFPVLPPMRKKQVVTAFCTNT